MHFSAKRGIAIACRLQVALYGGPQVPTFIPPKRQYNDMTTTSQQHDNDMTTTQRHHNNTTTTPQRQHNNITTTLQQHHNNNTILLKQAAGAVRENLAKPLPLSIRDDQGVIPL